MSLEKDPQYAKDSDAEGVTEEALPETRLVVSAMATMFPCPKGIFGASAVLSW